MIPVDFCQKKRIVIDFTTDEMISKFEVFTKNKIDTLYLTEIMITERPQKLYEFWYEGDKHYSGAFDF